jgi:hypothetical protein
VRKLADYFTRQFGEPHKMVFMEVVDGLGEFLMRFSDELAPAWVYDALAGLLAKKGADQNVVAAAKVRRAIYLIF